MPQQLQPPPLPACRSILKLFSEEDYLGGTSPRAAYVLDGMRALLTGPTVEAVHAAMAEISLEFDGVAAVKNPFALSLPKREERAHLLLINMTVVFDAKLTMAELLADTGKVDAVVQRLLAKQDGQPRERRERGLTQAVAVLSDASLAGMPVISCAEVQATFTAFGEARASMHYMYDVGRAGSDSALHANFAEADAAHDAVAKRMFGACQMGQLSVVERLLEVRGADVNADLSDGATGLLLAAEANHPDVVGCLLGHGAAVNQADTNGTTPLIGAAAKGFGAVVAQLVAAQADVNQANTKGTTPLSKAAQNGHGAVAKQLIAANADVHKANNKKETPLFITEHFGHSDVVAILKAAGAK